MELERETLAAVNRMRKLPVVQYALEELQEKATCFAYHNILHAEEVLTDALLFGLHDKLTDEDLELLAIAAVYHDIGYLEGKEGHEARSASVAANQMQEQGYAQDRVEIVKAAILDTSFSQAEFQQPETQLGKYLCDADVGNFGRADFFEKVELLAKEFELTQDEMFKQALTNLRKHQWQTEAAAKLRAEGKQANLTLLESKLTTSGVGFVETGSMETIELREGETITLGRDKGNTLSLNDGLVSRHHATVSCSRLGLVVSDLGSKNGTYLNERRLSAPELVTNEAAMCVGERTFKLRFSGGSKVENISLHDTATSEFKTSYVSVLVVDVVGYTRLSRELPAKAISEALEKWYRLVERIVQQAEGELDKFIGDAVMVYWLGHNKQDAAAKAFDVARQIVDESQHLEWSHAGTHPWRVRAAINSGSAMVGAIGGSGRREFTVLGDTVNLTFRLESLASSLGEDIVLGAETEILLREKYPLRSCGHHNVAGYSEAVEIFSEKSS